MSGRSLEDLLRIADEGDVALPDRREPLAQHVLRRRCRERQLRTSLAASAIVLVSATALYQLGPTVESDGPRSIAAHAPPQPVAARSEPTDTQLKVTDTADASKPDVHQLLREAERTAELVHEKLAEQAQRVRIEALERELAALERYNPQTPSVHVTAAIAVAVADNQRDRGLLVEAEATYRHVVAVYPDTPGGAEARDRLLNSSTN